MDETICYKCKFFGWYVKDGDKVKVYCTKRYKVLDPQIECSLFEEDEDEEEEEEWSDYELTLGIRDDSWHGEYELDP